MSELEAKRSEQNINKTKRARKCISFHIVGFSKLVETQK